MLHLSKIESCPLIDPYNLLQCEIFFEAEEIVAVKHNRKREQWVFSLRCF